VFSLTTPGSFAGRWLDKKLRLLLKIARSSKQQPARALARIHILSRFARLIPQIWIY